MRDGVTETVAEAQAQTFTLPSLADWLDLATRLDGYKIGEELSFNVLHWGNNQVIRYQQIGIWDLDVLSMRLMLYRTCRVDRFTGYASHGQDELVDSLLRALSKQTGLSYPPQGEL